MQRQISFFLAFLVLLCCGRGFAEECGVIPAHPRHLELRSPNPEAAYELSEKAYLAYENKEFHCAAYYGLEAFLSQPDAVLALNVANALKEGGQLDAALAYAEHALSRNPGEQVKEGVNALLAELRPAVENPGLLSLTPEELQATAIQVQWTRYLRGDRVHLPPGEHSIVVERPGQNPSTELISLPLPVANTEPLEEPADNSWLLITGSVTAGVGAALLVTTIIVDVAAGSKRSEYDEIGDCLRASAPSSACSKYTDDVARSTDDYNRLGDEVESLVGIETITLAAGAVLTAAGSALLIWYLLSPSDTAEASAATPYIFSLAPSPRWDGATLLFGMSF
ncbi:MAG: hypothetical protein RBU37_27985 [Myxococcota bacterium]|jgi:tetratricopeptide (TPR) repeat protein|nr:hypothetical protein [Myxococcota bacterium]